MRRIRHTLTASGTALFAALAFVGLAACGEGTGPAGTGEAQVVLTSSSGAASSLVAGSIDPYSYAAASPTLSNVSSIMVEVDRVDLLPAGSSSSAAGPWVSVEVDAQMIDLMDLGAEGVTLAAGDVAAGDYRAVRLFITGGTMTFEEDVTFGSGPAAQTYAAGEEHEFTVPSAEQTGIKVPGAELTVEEGATGTVELTFDAAASVQNVNVSARGLMMAPVIIAAGGGA